MAQSNDEDPEKTNLQEQQLPKQASATEPPPDGGSVAWVQVFASFWLWFNTFGISNAFGVFVTYYQVKFPDKSPAVISLIGSVQPFVIVFFGFLAGPLWDAGYCRSLVIAGTSITSFGYFMVSICDSYWQVMLAQGVVAGFGSCFLYLPAVAIIPQYFSKRKALANGIAASGSSLGGTIYPIAFRQLLQHLSFGWSVRVLAFMILATGTLSFFTIRRRVIPTARRSLKFDYRSFVAEPAYGIYTIAFFFTLAAQYTPPFFIQEYATAKASMSDDLASYLLPILNATSIIGRILPNLISDRIGGINVLTPSVLAATVLGFAWIGITSTAGCIVFASLYGLFIGAILSLPPFVFATLCPDPKLTGTRMGNAFAVASFGLLMGPPIGGAILQSQGWLATQLYAGAMLAVATAALICVRVYIAGWKIRVRV